jgi:FAD/FMN-containing dehydrogenase
MATLVTSDLQGLRRLASGRLRMPGDPGFTAASAPFNKRFAATRPAAVLSVSSVADVTRAVRWARENGVQLTARGGGHGYCGASVSPGLVLDLRGLDAIEVDPSAGLVTVAGGVRTGALYAALERHGLALPLGNSDDVGIGGLTLGGGVSAVSRAYGLTCDRLVATEVVTADGEILACDSSHEPDLFWACRGGGGGNFGVNVSFTFETRPAVASATCLLLWDWSAARQVLPVAQEVMRHAPGAFSARIGVSRAAGEDGVVSMIGQHLGSSQELRSLLAPVLVAARPSRADIADRTYWEAKDFLRHATCGDPFAVRTRVAPRPLTAEGVDVAVRAVEAWPGSGNPDGGGVALFTWGGAINDVAVPDTAFPHRDALFLVSMDTSWSWRDEPQAIADNLRWLDALYDDMAGFATGAAYANFADPGLPDWRSAYYGPNLARLQAVKRRYDPSRFFSYGQAV